VPCRKMLHPSSVFLLTNSFDRDPLKCGLKIEERRQEGEEKGWKHVAPPLIISASDLPPYSFWSLMMVGSPSVGLCDVGVADSVAWVPVMLEPLWMLGVRLG
jgi:hypothetical protein